MALKITKRENDTSGTWFHIAAEGNTYHYCTEADLAEGLIGWEPDARLKVRPGGNARVRQLARTLSRQYQRFRRGGELPLKIEDNISREVLAREVLLDWEGVQLGDGSTEYTPAAGIRAMEDDPAFFQLVADIANDLARDRHEAITEDSETLGNGSGGGSSSGASQERGPRDD